MKCYHQGQRKWPCSLIYAARSKHGIKPLTSKVNDSTTSDFDSWISFSSPMSKKAEFCERFNFCNLNSGPPFETGRLSKLAISKFTEDRNSSIYIFSISFAINLGNFLSLKIIFKIIMLHKSYFNFIVKDYMMYIYLTVLGIVMLSIMHLPDTSVSTLWKPQALAVLIIFNCTLSTLRRIIIIKNE